MLKKRDLHEVPKLFELMCHPQVFPYVRHKAAGMDEFYFLTKQTIEQEEAGLLVSRTILDECQQPIGTINLFDIHDKKGFLATWIGQPFFGKGYNRIAKEQFLEEVFISHGMDAVFIKIRQSNERSMRAALKLPYLHSGQSAYPDVYQAINAHCDVPVYDLFVITPASYFLHRHPIEVSEGEAVV
ncbi:GNAT family N-acetyltransferase [Sediminibacillus halophilus]|uniref:Protein N-acetyltransferase, RimJ/RimL family n=1 Tax=Sediminibacillus halophilus TaxID=482461 RepID=A0A1G9VIJ0_9BACI|nr:GNAT family N-acetyltransferase [Sediminibacillus halophilus]SDM71897.1 Protein N-acetyltransferase, RimJ/RimL family [Sediminibacillus halophilus]